MRIGFMVAAIFALGSSALAEGYGRPTAILDMCPPHLCCTTSNHP
jgi:hypothetical protein